MEEEGRKEEKDKTSGWFVQTNTEHNRKEILLLEEGSEIALPWTFFLLCLVSELGTFKP